MEERQEMRAHLVYDYLTPTKKDTPRRIYLDKAKAEAYVKRRVGKYSYSFKPFVIKTQKVET